MSTSNDPENMFEVFVEKVLPNGKSDFVPTKIWMDSATLERMRGPEAEPVKQIDFDDMRIRAHEAAFEKAFSTRPSSDYHANTIDGVPLSKHLMFGPETTVELKVKLKQIKQMEEGL